MQKISDKKKKLIIFLSLLIISFVLDMGSKTWANATLSQKYLNPSVQHPFSFYLNLAYNKGAAFSLFSNVPGGRWILSIFGLFAMGFIYYLYKRPESDNKLFLYGLGLVGGGALGNIVDRIIFGHVTDFIQVWVHPSIKIAWPWPTFNVADVVLLIGISLMMLFSLTYKESEKEKDGKQGE